MMDNILFGPITLYRSNEERWLQVQDLLNEGWLPLYSRTKGEFVDQIRATTPNEDQKLFKGLIICIGYKIIPKE